VGGALAGALSGVGTIDAVLVIAARQAASLVLLAKVLRRRG
jgi:hypothetical protein